MTAFPWPKIRNVHSGPKKVDWEMQNSKVNRRTINHQVKKEN